MFNQLCSGKFSLVGTLAGHYGHIPYRYRGGGGLQIYVQTVGGEGVFFLDNGRNCNTSRLRCPLYGAYTALFNFIARGFEGMLFREFFFKEFNWVHSRVYFDIY